MVFLLFTMMAVVCLQDGRTEHSCPWTWSYARFLLNPKSDQWQNRGKAKRPRCNVCRYPTYFDLLLVFQKFLSLGLFLLFTFPGLCVRPIGKNGGDGKCGKKYYSSVFFCHLSNKTTCHEELQRKQTENSGEQQEKSSTLRKLRQFSVINNCC